MSDTTENNSDLICVVQLFRHGERTPSKFYKNDPHASHWKGKLDELELTNKGKSQLFELAKITRSRYADFLPQKYDRNLIGAYTTDFNRTHMSGQCYLYGLFQAEGDQVWKENLDWQPIPLRHIDVHTLNEWPCPCSDYMQLWMDVFKTKKYVDQQEEYKRLYNYLTRHSGQNIENYTDILCIFDCLRVESGVGLEIPDWAKKVYPEPLKTLAGITLESFTHTKELKQIAIGGFLNEIVHYFDRMSSDKPFSQKYQIFSAHDTNLAAILNCLGAFDAQSLPSFASSLWIELRKSAEGQYYVNVYYRNNEELQQINIKEYGFNCPLDNFKSILEGILVNAETLEKNCNLKKCMFR